MIQNFIFAHWEIVTALSAYVFLAFVGAMPAPDDPRPFGRKTYDLLYTALHLLANKVTDRKPQYSLPEIKEK